MTVTRIGAGVYRVEIEGRSETVYVAGASGQMSAFWNGRLFVGPFDEPAGTRPLGVARDRRQVLSAPMPAKVIKVLVEPGAVVARGEVVVILEAMKMELPVRSAANATVKTVHCREGDLVQPDTVLVQLDADV